ncbi:MAG: L-seryl-tRNA(Sec) selenium transferase [Candidatus Promineifilaceae bacterium]
MSENLDQKASSDDVRKIMRTLPSVDRFVGLPDVNELVEEYGRALVVNGIRLMLARWRSQLSASESIVPDDLQLTVELREWLIKQMSPTLRTVVNATGVIVHTNLGRSPLSSRAMEYVTDVALGYSTLEYDLDRGSRGSRSIHVESQLVEITGAEAALVVNNNAAAVLLMLTALCRGKDVIISRGQLVEIGGGFRIPDVLRQSGARLVEVGTTNKTHLYDYENALSEKTGAILVAHHSNYKVVGFTSEPGLEELTRITQLAGVPLLYDQGSGALIDMRPYGLENEPTVMDSLGYGADLIAFSGDKLLGGPQAGILCGRKQLISILKRHPLARAVRADKLCLSALSITLNSFVTGKFDQEIPIWQMIARPLEVIDNTAREWVQNLVKLGIAAEVIDGESTIGGGSLPGTSLPTRLVAIASDQPDALASRLRSNDPPIIGRIAKDRLLLDPRTVLAGQVEDLLRAIERFVNGAEA